MRGVLQIGDEARQLLVRRFVLQRVRRSQDALRRRWQELSREEVGAELVAIGRELLEATPSLLRTLDSGGKVATSRERRPRLHRPAGAGDSWEQLVRVGQSLADALEQMVRDLHGQGPKGGRSP